PASTSEPLGQRRSPSARADYHQVDGIAVVIASHTLLGHRSAMDVEQEGRVVIRRAKRPPRERPDVVRGGQPHAPSSPRSRVSLTGSGSEAALPSQLSRWPVPSL